jgi:FkbM family methyltransferase
VGSVGFVQDDLIIDVGMHVGRDTEFYLAKGFRVAAIEANPSLVLAARERFRDELAAGTLRMLETAIADKDGPVDFYVSDDHDTWSTTSPDWVARNIGRGAAHRRIEVEGTRFESILAEVGTPYYLKMDIEGADLLCIAALATVEQRPAFVSLELPTSRSEALEAVSRLSELGYRGFKVVDQSLQQFVRCPRPPREGRYVKARFDGQCTGLFGRETPGREWRSQRATEQMIGRILKRMPSEATSAHRRQLIADSRVLHSMAALIWRSHSRRLMGRFNRWRGTAWFDLHARLTA